MTTASSHTEIALQGRPKQLAAQQGQTCCSAASFRRLASCAASNVSMANVASSDERSSSVFQDFKDSGSSECVAAARGTGTYTE